MPRSVSGLPARPDVLLREGDVIAQTPFGTRVPVTLTVARGGHGRAKAPCNYGDRRHVRC
ncbi:hypothetical protein [Nocardioides albertanoniae]|nr:hypothetical protein [Nocardioides albertanoniae]